MKKVHIYGNKTTHNTGGYDPEDKWSRDSTDTSWGIRGCAEVVPDRYESFDDIDTDLTGTLYAVYTIHSTGDSFGHDESAYFEFVWVYDNVDKAKAAIQLIRDHAEWYRKRHGWRPEKVEDKRFKDDYSLTIDIGKDKPMTVCASWNGYFESLNEVDLVVFQLGE